MKCTMAQNEVNDVVMVCTSVPEELGQPNPHDVSIEHPQLDAHTPHLLSFL